MELMIRDRLSWIRLFGFAKASKGHQTACSNGAAELVDHRIDCRVAQVKVVEGVQLKSCLPNSTQLDEPSRYRFSLEAVEAAR